VVSLDRVLFCLTDVTTLHTQNCRKSKPNCFVFFDNNNDNNNLYSPGTYTPILLNRKKNNIFLYLIKPGAGYDESKFKVIAQLKGCVERDSKLHLIDCKILIANCFTLPCTEEKNLT